MAQIEIRYKTEGDGLAAKDELSLRHRFQEEIESRGIGKDLGGGSGWGEMDIDVEVTSDVGQAKSKLRELAKELGIKEGLIIEEHREPSEIEAKAPDVRDKKSEGESHFGDLGSCNTRAQAIENGELVDVSAIAKEAGIVVPVALTRAAFKEHVSELWDLVWILQTGIQSSESAGDKIGVKLVVQDGLEVLREVTLKAALEPGDDGEPAITVMLPGED